MARQVSPIGQINVLTRDLPDGQVGSPDLETATAIQALALALSASRSARHGALSPLDLRPLCTALLFRRARPNEIG